jgi:hypothetical protein
VFETGRVLDVAIRTPDGRTVADLGTRVAPPLPILPGLTGVLPGGLRRGSTVAVAGSVSLLLALLGAASADGAWCALVGMPQLNAEAAVEYGVDLSRLAVVPAPQAGWAGAGWTTAVGALLDAVDIVVARPPARVLPGDVRRLAARVRTREAVLMPFGAADWPNADVRLTARESAWDGVGRGYGRLRRRRVLVEAAGRGAYARPRSAGVWLPAPGGGVVPVEQQLVAPVQLAASQLAASQLAAG